MVPFAQFKRPEKHPWSSVIFSKVAVTKSNTFSNCKKGTKSCKASYIVDYDMSNCVGRLSQYLNIDLISSFHLKFIVKSIFKFIRNGLKKNNATLARDIALNIICWS